MFSWAVAVWWLHGTPGPWLDVGKRPLMTRWKDAESWTIALPIESGWMHVRRKGDTFHVDGDPEGARAEAQLVEPPDVTKRSAAIGSGLQEAKMIYLGFKSAPSARRKATYFLLILYLVQEVFFIAYRRIVTKYYAGLRVMSLLCWSGGAVWLFMFYFGR